MDSQTLKTLTSSASTDWCTPTSFLEKVYKVDKVLLDPCSNPHSDVVAKNKIMPPGDGLAFSWSSFGELSGDGLVYVNPPYGRKIGHWVKKCAAEAAEYSQIVLLIPARTDTKYWHEHIFPTADAICFIKGRLTFKGAPAPAPFPSAAVYWGMRSEKFASAFGDSGVIMYP